MALAPARKTLFDLRYYDKPDGEDLFGKMVYTNKVATYLGVGVATHDVLLFSHTKGYGATLARYLWYLAPMCGIASAFTMGTFISTRLREKDDVYNYYVGSLMAGGVVGAWAKCPNRGGAACIAFCLASYAKRVSLDEGWEFFPEVKQGWGNFRSMKHDFTIVPEGERGWTKTK